MGRGIRRETRRGGYGLDAGEMGGSRGKGGISS